MPQRDGWSLVTFGRRRMMAQRLGLVTFSLSDIGGTANLTKSLGGFTTIVDTCRSNFLITTGYLCSAVIGELCWWRRFGLGEKKSGG